MHYTAFFFFFPVKHGVTPKDASYFVGRSYLSMVQDAERNCQNPKRFDDLIEEQTPGGLNEQVRACLSPSPCSSFTTFPFVFYIFYCD